MSGKSVVYVIVLLSLSLFFFANNGGCTRNTSSIEGIDVTEMKVKEVVLEPNSGNPIVIIQDLYENVSLSIWIGASEAFAIATKMEEINFYRPMTHDLMRNILKEVKVSVIRVIITDLKDDTYFAVIVIRYRGRELVVDSRPSDAIALALRTNAPIFVSTHLLNSRGVWEKLENI
jgi:bifunctional DNase/RNase